MRWIIENNVAGEELYDDFVDAVSRFDNEVLHVKRIPFTVVTEPAIEDNVPSVVFGSVSLTLKVAPLHGWKVFTNDNFDYAVWGERWKGHLLNEDAEVGPFDEVSINEEQFFIRPTRDNKAFSGIVMSIQSYYDWLDQLRIGEESSLGLDFDLKEQVMVSPVQHIQREVRVYVVGGKVVTHSTYRIGEQIRYYDYLHTDPDAIFFVEDRILEWVPDDAFVLDLAVVDGQYKIIEINCINSSGFYRADVNALVGSLTNILG